LIFLRDFFRNYCCDFFIFIFFSKEGVRDIFDYFTPRYLYCIATALESRPAVKLKYKEVKWKRH